MFRYGGMPLDVAEGSMRLFAAEIMPELQKLAPVTERVTYDDAALVGGD